MKKVAIILFTVIILILISFIFSYYFLKDNAKNIENQFKKELSSVKLLETYNFKEDWSCWHSGGGSQYSAEGEIKNNELVSLEKQKYYGGGVNYTQENISCSSIQDCQNFLNEIKYLDEIIIQINEEVEELKLIIERESGDYKSYFDKFSTTKDRTCYAYKVKHIKTGEVTGGYFLVCFNENKELVNYRSQSEYCGNVIRKQINDYDFESIDES